MDPLSALVAVLRPHAILSKPIEGAGLWGVRYAAFDLPGYALVLSGHCWLTIAGEVPRRLDAGDFILSPAMPAFALTSEPHAITKLVEPSSQPVRHGDPDVPATVRLLGGSFRIEPANTSLLRSLLPDLIHLRAAEIGTMGLSRIAGLIADESSDDRPGADMILQRLLEIMLIAVLRHGPQAADAARSGLLAGLRDPALARALRAIHDDVRHRWTVASLAELAGMSRSAFAARFAAAVGCSPIEYLGRWRMALARDALARGGASLDRLADDIGYESASAFSTAFRRRFGCAPGAFARSLASAA